MGLDDAWGKFFIHDGVEYTGKVVESSELYWTSGPVVSFDPLDRPAFLLERSNGPAVISMTVPVDKLTKLN